MCALPTKGSEFVSMTFLVWKTPDTVRKQHSPVAADFHSALVFIVNSLPMELSCKKLAPCWKCMCTSAPKQVPPCFRINQPFSKLRFCGFLSWASFCLHICCTRLLCRSPPVKPPHANDTRFLSTHQNPYRHFHLNISFHLGIT